MEPTVEVVSMEEIERGKQIQTDVQIIMEVISQVCPMHNIYNKLVTAKLNIIIVGVVQFYINQCCIIFSV